jgi:hypothetical protein
LPRLLERVICQEEVQSPPLLPHGSPRRPGPRLVLLVAFAASGAAVASMFLVRGILAGFVAFGVAAAMVYGGIALLVRRPIVPLLVMGAPVALVGLLTMSAESVDGPTGPRIHVGIQKISSSILLGSIFLGLALALVFNLAVRVAHRVRSRPSHDALDRVLVAAALWVGLTAGGAAVAGVALPLGRGGITWIAEGLALALGAACAGWALRRDVGLLRLLRAIREGRAPAWEIVPRVEVEPKIVEAPPLPYLASCPDDGALIRWTSAEASVFRKGSSSSIMAWISLDPSPMNRMLRRRAALAAALLAAEGAGAAALLGASLVHARPLTGVVAVSVGEEHACALRGDGEVLCWGNNVWGEAGPDAGRVSHSAAHVEGLRDAVQISGACALRREGEVLCWGSSDANRRRPTPVPGLPPARRIASGGWGACALTMDDDVFCWDHDRPRMVRALAARGALDLVVTWFGGCARVAEGLQCWERERGMTDPKARSGPRPLCRLPGGAPPPVAGSLVKMASMICEVSEPGRVRCWDPPREAASECHEAIEIGGAPGARRAASGISSCVLDGQGNVQCWRPRGQDPFAIGGGRVLEGAVELASNGRSTLCAIRTDGTVWCWGSDNQRGEIGDGTRRASWEPTRVMR